jgi:hypothetical protein
MSATSAPTTPKPRRRWLQFSLRTLMVFVLFVSLGVGALTMMRERARQNARLYGTRNAFRWVYFCLSEYDERCKHLPYPVRRETVGRKTEFRLPNGNGRPLYSWRGEISAWTKCCYSGHVRDRSEPWDSPANQDAEHVGPGPYCYSSHDEEGEQASCETNMLGICGPGTAFGCEDEPPRSLKSLGSNAILVTEVRRSGIHWMQPGDFDIRDMPHTINATDGQGVSSRYPGGFHVLFSDGQVWFLSEKTPFETLAKFFTVGQANECKREELLAAFVLWRSSM